MPSVEDAAQFVEAMCGEHSNNIARLQEEHEKLSMQLREVDRNLKDQHDRLRVGNQLMDILVKDRVRREELENVPMSAERPMTAQEKYERSTGIDTLGMPGRNY